MSSERQFHVTRQRGHNPSLFLFFFFNDTAPTDIYTLSLHDALPIWRRPQPPLHRRSRHPHRQPRRIRSEEHTSELQSRFDLVCRLLLEKKKKNRDIIQLAAHTIRIAYRRSAHVCLRGRASSDTTCGW